MIDPAADSKTLEKYSAAVTLSDMEIFIFPELLFSLVLANIMSPRIWRWRDYPWFKKTANKSAYRKILRLKQYIIDHYEFNLDLDTWGLTTQQQEIKRFLPWINEETLQKSNALFGYEGDRYYFDLDIRKHFGLDKYNSDIIPYWKTETVEAMDAFKYREEYSYGAGECVSLSTLYAAAMFVACGIPLEDIFLLATPLHSQNFIDINSGILTNNRRILTSKMWFNGSELTDRAQRALRNEQVTIVANNSGYVHIEYPVATMNQNDYHRFQSQLGSFLTTAINDEILINFLRQHRDYQSCFQLRHDCHGKPRYVPLETIYHYENGSAYRFHNDTLDNLLAEIDEYEFYNAPLEGRLLLNQLENFFKDGHVHIDDRDAMERLEAELLCQHDKASRILKDLRDFAHMHPRLPHHGKQFKESPAIKLTPEMSREDILEYLSSLRETHPVADLAFYSARDLKRTSWTPFSKAAIERNPVSVAAAQDLDDSTVIAKLQSLPNSSIYDETRVAQPDEVWNYGRGDGLELAFCLANVWKHRHPDTPITLSCKKNRVHLKCGKQETEWKTSKGLENQISL